MSETNIVDEVLDGYRAEYLEVSTIWRDLERKAQNIIGFSGVLLAAVLAFTRRGEAEISIHLIRLMSTAIVLLAIALIIAWISLLIRDFKDPPLGKELHDELTTDEEGEVAGPGTSQTEDLKWRLAARWRETIEDVDHANSIKSNLVGAAQLLMISAIVCSAIVSLAFVWS